MIPKVYFSIPISLDWDTEVSPILQAFTNHQSNSGLHLNKTYWDRNTSYNIKVHQQNALVVILPDNAWQTPFSQIPSGVMSEINKAIASGVGIYIPYTPNTINKDKTQFYQIDSDLFKKGYLAGKIGSSAVIWRFLANISGQSINSSHVGMGKTAYIPIDETTVMDSSGSMIQEGDVIVTLHQPEDRRILLLKR